MKNKTPLYITGLVVLALLVAFLGWELSKNMKENKAHQTEIDELNTLMSGNGINDLMEDNLTSSLSNLLDEYNSVSTDNQDLTDSIAIQKEKVTLLLDELKKSERRRRYSSSELKKMTKEAATLRKVMKNYVHRVDSLNALTKELQAEIVVKDNTIDKVSGERDQFKEQTENLTKTVELGARLQILNLKSEAIRIRNSGSFDETTRARRADQVRGCFTVVDNKITKPGNKTFYMRVISPEGKVLTNTKSESITVDEEEIEVSISRTVDYQNTAINLCIFYEKSMETLPKGDYKVEIYSDGGKVGSSNFALR